MQLSKAEKSEFAEIYSAMERSFVREERRDREDAERLLSNERYSVFKIQDEGIDVGFITVWELSDFAFAEHFVVYENFRCRGYGAAALELIKKKFTRVVLEVEPPVSDIQKRRFAFYQRCGFVPHREYYLQPPYRKSDEGVELVLMSYPESLYQFDEAVKDIHTVVYGYIQNSNL